ncbi:MAG: glycosyltransferase family 4 protein [Desulfobacterales bacterium]|jgi:glycosyltransferase involved in cell wall biosynthesis
MDRRLLAISNHASMLGGGEHSFLDLMSHLRGWSALAATPEYGELGRRLQEAGVPTTVLPLPPLRPDRPAPIVRALWAMVGAFRSHRASLVYANGSRAAVYAGLAARLFGLPLVWHCRIAGRDRYLDPLLERLSKRIVVNSRATSRRFSAIFRPKIRVVHNGIDLSRFANCRESRPHPGPTGGRLMITVARVSRWKRHHDVLAAFEKLATENPDLHLACIGGPDPEDLAWWKAMQERTRRSFCRDRIHWLGAVADVAPWYKAADLFVLASENESFGRVVIEAMASGVPVLATNGGGIPEIITHDVDGMLFSTGDVSMLVELARRILKDPLLRNRIVEEGTRTCQGFSLERHVKKMTLIFEEAVKAGVRNQKGRGMR